MQTLGETTGIHLARKTTFNEKRLFQVTGLGTALKILFSGEFDNPLLAGLPAVKKDLKLSRNEIVALFNAFGKISTSIVELERFREMLRKR